MGLFGGSKSTTTNKATNTVETSTALTVGDVGLTGDNATALAQAILTGASSNVSSFYQSFDNFVERTTTVLTEIAGAATNKELESKQDYKKYLVPGIVIILVVFLLRK